MKQTGFIKWKVRGFSSMVKKSSGNTKIYWIFRDKLVVRLRERERKSVVEKLVYFVGDTTPYN